jgi:hypothetical protein
MSLTKVTYAMIEGALLNVLDYGAVGDGVANDAPAIQAAITAATASGKTLYFPTGTYLFNSKLTFTCSVLGENFPQVKLKAGGSALSTSDYAVQVGGSGISRRMSMRNIYIEGDNTTTANNGLLFNSQWFSNHSNIWVRGFYGYAIQIAEESYWNVFEDIMANFDGEGGTWVAPLVGIICLGSSGKGVTQSTFINIKANGRNYGMEMRHCDQLQIINFDGQNAGAALGIGGTSTNINVLSLYAENCTLGAVYNDSTSCMITGMSITGTPTKFVGAVDPIYMEFAGTYAKQFKINKADNAMGYTLVVNDSSEVLSLLSSRAGAAVRTFALGTDLNFSVNGTSAIFTSGSNSPEGVITAPVGSIYTRTNGSANTTLYVKESGSGNTGWVAK